MNESSIRDRLSRAIGLHEAPPDLAGRVRARLSQPRPDSVQRAPRFIAVVAGVLTVVLVATLAYASQANRARVNPAPSPSIAGAASPSPSPSPSQPALVAVAGPCKLPITWGVDGSVPPAPAAGFITFPGAGFAADPTATMTQNGEYWFSYNTTTHHWLPVLSQFASPDGTKYLFFTLANGTLMHITDVTTGQGYDLQNDSINWHPVGMDNGNAYAAGESHNGLYRLPFQIGPPQVVVPDGYWAAISGAYAWGFASASVPAGAPSVLERLDLATGSVARFATFAESIQIIGFDGAGLPILSTAGGQTITTLSPSGDATVIATGFPLAKAPNFGYSPYTAVGDSHGVWLAGTDGIYLYSDGKLGKVSNVIAIPASGCA